ncbi:cation channel sperm-associated auxiliary subunit beta-like [Heteronotia binoei]|uniref:cation channel sperm-associated auxiliary subunit beta-like n=1 Tax=Heteronotia binoei TaxID=13085 RepID=UPI0029307EF8|nr:cation channel sperm-associated auxiliary subunit beta-like [Heteronotia binoei]
MSKVWKLLKSRDIAPTEQWYVKFIMHHGLNMFTTEGSLLDLAREPILQWEFGDEVDLSNVIPNVINITVSKSPCASDVAIMGLILDKGFAGIYIAVSWSAFMTDTASWTNLKDNICVTLEYDCADLALLNVILTNTRIVFLTTLGLFISEDLRYGNFRDLKFSKPNFCGFERDDYYRAKIWYNVQCLANQEDYEVDYISVSFNKDKTLSQESTCFYSNDPYTKWHSCLPHRTPAERLISRRVVAFMVDYQQNTGIGVLTQQDGIFVSVNTLTNHELHKKRKFPEFWFPDAEFRASGMLFHPNSHFLYVYGNQVWLSEDGGNTFQLLIKLINETVVKTDTCVYTQAIIFVTDNGSVFYTKAGLYKYARLTIVQHDVFNLNFDHLGVLNFIILDENSTDSLKVDTIEVDALLKVEYTVLIIALSVHGLYSNSGLFGTLGFLPCTGSLPLKCPLSISALVLQFIATISAPSLHLIVTTVTTIALVSTNTPQSLDLHLLDTIQSIVTTHAHLQMRDSSILGTMNLMSLLIETLKLHFLDLGTSNPHHLKPKTLPTFHLDTVNLLEPKTSNTFHLDTVNLLSAVSLICHLESMMLQFALLCLRYLPRLRAFCHHNLSLFKPLILFLLQWTLSLHQLNPKHLLRNQTTLNPRRTVHALSILNIHRAPLALTLLDQTVFSRLMDLNLTTTMAEALNVTIPSDSPKILAVVHDLVQADFPTGSLLPMLPVHLEGLCEAWGKPASAPLTLKRFDSLYRIHAPESKFLASHPAPNSIIVHSASKAKPSRHPTPPDREDRKLDTLAHKIYNLASTISKVNNYLAYFSAYAFNLVNQFTPLIPSLLETSQRVASNLVSELSRVSKQRIDTITHAVSNLVSELSRADDLAFDGPLAPHYITEEKILLFSYVPLVRGSHNLEPRFHDRYIGKAFEYKKTGSLPPAEMALLLLSSGPGSGGTHRGADRRKSGKGRKETLSLARQLFFLSSLGVGRTRLGTHIFKASDVEKTIMFPGSSSFLIIRVTSDLTALGEATVPRLVILNHPFPSGQWFMYDFGTTNGKKWKVTVDICRYTVQQLDDLPIYAVRYLDLGSTLNFAFRVTPVNVAYRVFHMHLMKVIVGKPNLLDVNTEAYWDDNDSYTVKIRVKSKFFEQGKTSIAAIVTEGSLRCDVTTLILTLKNSCSYLKVMHYKLPVQLSASEWLLEMANASKYLKNLPVNYRPPSRLGIAVPLTENFYNADPGKPRMRDYFQGSKASGTYKQCANKSSRSECGCTDNMKLSFFVAFSDCKEKAIRMKYPISNLPLSFTIENEEGSVNLSSPYYVTITEINNRTNWEISGTNATSSMLKMRNYFGNRLKETLYNPDGLTLSIYGSELFHFRVSAIPGVSFCSLFDEFQIYVDDAPLAFPGDYLITSLTAVVIGFIIFVAFILQAYDIQVWSILKQKLKQTSKVSPKVSLTTTVSTSTEFSDQ